MVNEYDNKYAVMTNDDIRIFCKTDFINIIPLHNPERPISLLQQEYMSTESEYKWELTPCLTNPGLFTYRPMYFYVIKVSTDDAQIIEEQRVWG